ncbi:olfactomedin-like [Clarias gariepinus]|uniref:olfactomedin-like n=1 Tax=Clarias gariepinus TaxID=13013 RepID=UPI00234C1668|nr:olfactomedin-like [Clarias gariepinus]
MREKLRYTHSLKMILLVLLLTIAGCGHAVSISGQEKNDACVCDVNSSIWGFPAAKYDSVLLLVQNCHDSLQRLQAQTAISAKALPRLNAIVSSVRKRLEKFQYLKNRDLYNALYLKNLSKEIQKLHDSMNEVQIGRDARRVRQELEKFKDDVEVMYKRKIFNLETVRDKLRYLNNRVQISRTIPQDFRSSCSQHVLKNISAPVVTKLNPYSTSYVSGAWGHDTGTESDLTYWIQSLASSNMLGITVRFYKTYEDFMSGKNYKDETLVSSYSNSYAIQGPGTIVYNGVVYYECYYKPDLCAYEVKTKQFRRLTLPDAGFNNKFPYCYYSCLDYTDISLSADDKGLWAIYATEANYGNIVVSRVDPEGFNITHTWKTRLFKRSVTNTFIVCGVLYATRFINTYKEEVFYAFDLTTGLEDNTLAIPMDKVAAGVASLHYNPKDMMLYMYNGGYMLSYQAYF